MSLEELGEALRRARPAAVKMIRRCGVPTLYREDVYQNACLKATRGISSFRGESKFSSWFCRIAINEARQWHRAKSNHLRAKSNHPAHPLEDDEKFRAPERPLEEYLDVARQTEVMLHAIASLSPAIREAVFVHCLRELDYHDAAQAMGISVAAVKSRIHRAYQKLRYDMRKYR